MKKLPASAQAFIVLIVTSGALAALWVWTAGLPRSSAPSWELGVFVVLGLLAGGKKITLTKHRPGDDEDEDGAMSIGFAITFAAMLHLGPAGGVCTAIAVGLSNALFPHVMRTHQLLFNLGLAILEATFGSLVFLTFNHWSLNIQPVASFPALAASCLTYYAVNTGGVATIIGFCSHANGFKVWRETFLWTAPSFFAGASAGAVALMIAGKHVGEALLFASPVAYLTYQSYSTYVGRQHEQEEHIEAIEVGKAHLAELYLATIKSLALAIDAKDQYTHQHILRVQRYAVAIAKTMGLAGDDLEAVNTGALLHDIGKLGVPEYVLMKPGRLTGEEFEKMKRHPEIGAAILDPVDFPWPVLPVVKHHHERWDGSGYPDGLKGEAIPLTARILAVADVYDALTSVRAYRAAWTHERAVELIVSESGTHFDPDVVTAFLSIIADLVSEDRATNALIENASAIGSLTSKADQAARAIQRASAELWALYEVAQGLSASLSLDETLEILAKKLEALMTGTTCVILLKDADGGTLRAQAAFGVNQEFFRKSYTMGPVSLSSNVLQSGRPYIGGYDHDDLMLTSNVLGEWIELRSSLVVPIVYESQYLGTMNLYHPDANAFSSSDLQLMETIAERAAMAIYNGMLFDRTRSHAATDQLTGLYNLRHIMEVIDTRAQKGGRFAILCLDLDSFKPINDNFGHLRGDAVLKDVADIFRKAVRVGDVVARYGGDEFLILLENVGRDEAAIIATGVSYAVATYDPRLHHERLGSLRLGVSVGFACFPEDGTDYHSLVSVADSRMYVRKTEQKLGLLVERSADIASQIADMSPNEYLN